VAQGKGSSSATSRRRRRGRGRRPALVVLGHMWLGGDLCGKTERGERHRKGVGAVVGGAAKAVARQPYRWRVERGRAATAVRRSDTARLSGDMRGEAETVRAAAARGRAVTSGAVKDGGAGILPAEAERDRAAMAVWRARTLTVGSGVRLRTGCRDGRPVSALWHRRTRGSAAAAHGASRRQSTNAWAPTQKAETDRWDPG
jgi:hypothetical protein